MWRPEGFVLQLTLAIASAASIDQAHAQGAGEPGMYRPGLTIQSRPMRVEILEGARFRDIETGQNYRLYGIDTCALGQRAELGRQPWLCGSVATAWLVAVTLNKWVACALIREDGGERLVRCAAPDHGDVAADMVREGIAVVAPATVTDPAVRAYTNAERDARKTYRGIWASTFQMPWDYRASAEHRGTVTAVAKGQR